ncbi:pentapeptide repeat-containing protein [Heliobacterium chlorum]|uniref:Pentapeptide repeat-containing protein n=1 Tax=Heliobacterium chlorum TaxID=2698 RepID=A0ABR7T4W2_HELCL|nr:pentapeptide repeat-containing protein [Heliobacterium chlorum]MBC9784706.1 pentapeptide repeat-containing protein [Heliobacterium chlorum]
MSKPIITTGNHVHNLKADCVNCFGLCCVALPFLKSVDFPFDKEGGTPCRNLQSDYRCGIHQNLRSQGFKGCTVYECFGAGQKVSQFTYKGNDWRENPESAKEMYDVFPIMQQLYEMLYYLNEALNFKEAQPIYQELQNAIEETERLTELPPKSILALNVLNHRATVSDLLMRASELVRAKVKKENHQRKQFKINKGKNLIGAKLRGIDLSGTSLRGALLIASDLREADLRICDLIGADVRDADLRGANLLGSIFLTQSQVNSAIGDIHTKLPPDLLIPEHWLAGD